jgi:hypothetical protein
VFKRDARLARTALRHNALRLSIEWSRIFPTSTAAVDLSGGITPAALAAGEERAHGRARPAVRAVGGDG